MATPSVIRETLAAAEPIRLDDAPAPIALFGYDNDTVIVQNYLPTASKVTISITGTVANIEDLLSRKHITPAPAIGRDFGCRSAIPTRTSLAFTVPPHSYMAFAAE